MFFLLLWLAALVNGKIEKFAKFIEPFAELEQQLKFKMTFSGMCDFCYESTALNDRILIFKHKISNVIEIPKAYGLSDQFKDYLAKIFENPKFEKNFSDFAFATEDHRLNWNSYYKNRNAAFFVNVRDKNSSYSGFEKSIIFVPFENERSKEFTYRSGKTVLELPLCSCSSPGDTRLKKCKVVRLFTDPELKEQHGSFNDFKKKEHTDVFKEIFDENDRKFRRKSGRQKLLQLVSMICFLPFDLFRGVWSKAKQIAIALWCMNNCGVMQKTKLKPIPQTMKARIWPRESKSKFSSTATLQNLKSKIWQQWRRRFRHFKPQESSAKFTSSAALQNLKLFLEKSELEGKYEDVQIRTVEKYLNSEN